MSQPKVLIIEDEEDIRNMYKLSLEKHWFQVEQLEDWNNALNKIKDFIPDVILLDIMMPFINWFDVLKDIKQNINEIYVWKYPKIIMCSNIDIDMYRNRCYDFWFDDYIIKSDITPRYLTNKIQKLLGISESKPVEIQEYVTKYPIVRWKDNQTLRNKSEKVLEFNAEIQELSNALVYLLLIYGWVWLAAPQIGKNLQILAYSKWDINPKIGWKKLIENEVMINPDIYYMSEEKVSFDETCLSIPWEKWKVERANIIKVKYLDKNWNQRDETFEWLNAVIIQHEVDHLNWILFTDKTYE